MVAYIVLSLDVSPGDPPFIDGLPGIPWLPLGALGSLGAKPPAKTFSGPPSYAVPDRPGSTSAITHQIVLLWLNPGGQGPHS